MKKMLVYLLLLVALIQPVSAETVRVVDDSLLLQPNQIEFVEEAFRQVELTHGFVPVAVTVDNFGGLTAQAYAENFYDAYSYRQDGILLLISRELSQWYILTSGSCADSITDEELIQMEETIVPLLSQGLYYESFMAFSDLAVACMQPEPAPESQPVVDEQEKSGFGIFVFLSFALGLGVVILVMGYLSSQLKSVEKRAKAQAYIQPGSVELTNRQDIFLYSQTQRIPRAQSSGQNKGPGTMARTGLNKPYKPSGAGRPTGRSSSSHTSRGGRGGSF